MFASSEFRATVGSLFGKRPKSAGALCAALLVSVASVARSDANPAATPAKGAVVPVFVAPPGWQHTQGTSDGIGTWLRPNDGDTPENILVEAKAGFPSLDALYNVEFRYISGLSDVFGYAPTDVTLCGNHPGKYLSYTYTGPDGNPITAEVVIAVFGTTAYSARYDKTITQWADAAAEKSIMTLCGHAPSH